MKTMSDLCEHPLENAPWQCQASQAYRVKHRRPDGAEYGQKMCPFHADLVVYACGETPGYEVLEYVPLTPAAADDLAAQLEKTTG